MALRAREELMHAGVPADKILAISTKNYSLSRTYSTAKETISKIDSIFPDQKLTINIVTRAIHSKRTYYAYKKNIGPKDSVGVIIAPPYEPVDLNNRKRNLKELAGIIYNILHF